MSAITVRELKEKLEKIPDNFVIAVDHVEFNGIGEAEINEDVEVIDIRRPMGAACISFVTAQNIVSEVEANGRFDAGYRQGFHDAKSLLG